MIPIASVIPFGCTIETYDAMATVHAPDGRVVAIVCGDPGKSGAEAVQARARMIAEIPRLISAAQSSLDAGMLLPLARGMTSFELAVQPPPDPLPA